jgi:2-polyprenyl-6-methoxyphenol hydroxylase-like FAD-dependent oxidoreductase
MQLVKRALIVGGGIAGMCTAIELRKRGVAVDLLELDAHWRVAGAGISINGAALRALKTIGVVDEVLGRGAGSDGVSLRTAGGIVVGSIPTPRIAGPEIAGAAGILRSVLAGILSEATLKAGVVVRLGVTLEAAAQDANGELRARCSDGAEARYDLIVGADGLHSTIRSKYFPDAPVPRYTGQGSWRAVVPRDPETDAVSIYMGKATKVGVNPISQNEMYVFCLDHRSTNERIPEEQWRDLLTGLLMEFSGPMERIRKHIKDSALVVYRPLESLLVRPPWNQGAIVLVGDAVHATTPHLAAGAALGMEDAIVLAEELDRAPSIEAAAAAYARRRFERCRMVVENSLRLGEIEIAGLQTEEHAGIMRESLVALLAPI